MVPGTNARQIWTHRTTSLFLDTFGRPDPNQDPPCERTTESTVVQSLHLMNSEKMHRDIVHAEGTAARLAKSEKSAAEVATHLYHLVFNRDPQPEETQLVEDLLIAEGANRTAVIQDVMWAMLNSAEFVIQN